MLLVRSQLLLSLVFHCASGEINFEEHQSISTRRSLRSLQETTTSSKDETPSEEENPSEEETSTEPESENSINLLPFVLIGLLSAVVCFAILLVYSDKQKKVSKEELLTQTPRTPPAEAVNVDSFFYRVSVSPRSRDSYGGVNDSLIDSNCSSSWSRPSSTLQSHLMDSIPMLDSIPFLDSTASTPTMSILTPMCQEVTSTPKKNMLTGMVYVGRGSSKSMCEYSLDGSHNVGRKRSESMGDLLERVPRSVERGPSEVVDCTSKSIFERLSVAGTGQGPAISMVEYSLGRQDVGRGPAKSMDDLFERGILSVERGPSKSFDSQLENVPEESPSSYSESTYERLSVAGIGQGSAISMLEYSLNDSQEVGRRISKSMDDAQLDTILKEVISKTARSIYRLSDTDTLDSWSQSEGSNTLSLNSISETSSTQDSVTSDTTPPALSTLLLRVVKTGFLILQEKRHA